MSTREERVQVLRMIEQGNITPDEGAQLLRALEAGSPQIPAGDQTGLPLDLPEEPVPGREATDPQVPHWSRWWLFPLWAGAGITILGAILVFYIYQAGGMNFWFYCSWLPFMFGLLVIIFAWYSRTARWLHVRVREDDGSRHNNISLSFPLPLGLAAWFLRNFGHLIPQLRGTQVDELIVALQETATPQNLFYVQVDDEDGSEHVEVYIG